MKTRGELKRDYKDSTPAMGVFVIRNLRNGRFLVHAARNLKGGMNRLKVEITPSTNPNVELLADWKELGPGRRPRGAEGDVEGAAGGGGREAVLRPAP